MIVEAQTYPRSLTRKEVFTVLKKTARVPFGRTLVTASVALTLSFSLVPAHQALAASDKAAAMPPAVAQQLQAQLATLGQAADEAAAALREKAKTPGEKAVDVAKEYRGVPYVAGGSTPSGFDCSGFTRYVYGKLGVKLTHNSQAQYNECSTKVARGDLQPGDLVFFGGSTSSINHVGIYVGDGKYIHSPQTGDVVSIDDLSRRTNYVGAARPR